MTKRESLLTALGLFAIALVVRAFFAAQIVFPKPEDTAYYVGVARNLLEGRGLVSDAIWSYSTEPLVFPKPAFEVWLPLPTFLAAASMAVLGLSFAASQIPFVLIGAVVPVLAWRLALDVAAERALTPERSRWLGLSVGLTTAVYLPLLLHSALPDSTMPFAAIVLAACLLMTRLLRDPRGARLTDPRLLGLGVLLGLGALTRNETAMLALLWAGLAWFTVRATPAVRFRMVAVTAVVAMIIFAPWAYRNILEFGSPLPGQAVTNALYLTGFDIFAWNHPPTLERHLALGAGALLELRLQGLTHNFVNVLLMLGLPISAIGLVALPWTFRSPALRPLVAISLLAFALTGLIFPAATQWGTFLHAAGPVHVLVVLSAFMAIDVGIVRLASRMGWTRPVAWLGAVLGVIGSIAFSATMLPSFGSGSRATEQMYEELGVRMAAIGRPLDVTAGPVISNFPIWMAETQRIPALALPDEPPEDVLHLARSFPGTELLVLIDPEGAHWPADLAARAPGSECFSPLDLGPYEGAGQDPLTGVTVFVIDCPGGGG